MRLIITLDLVFAVLAGISSYLLTRRDLSQRQAALVGVGCAVVVSLSFIFVLYLAVLAFIGAAATYWVLVRLVSLKQSLIVSATALAGLLAAGALAFALSLNSM